MNTLKKKPSRQAPHKPIDAMVWTDIDSMGPLDGIRVHVIKKQDGVFIKRIVEWRENIPERNFYLRPTPQAKRLKRLENNRNLPSRISFLKTLNDPPPVDVIANKALRTPTGDWTDSELNKYERELTAETLKTKTHIAKIDKLYSHNGSNDLFWGIVQNLKVASLWIEQFGDVTTVSGFKGKLEGMAQLSDSDQDGFDKCLFVESPISPAILQYWRTDDDWVNNPSNYITDDEGDKELQSQFLDITETEFGENVHTPMEQPALSPDTTPLLKAISSDTAFLVGERKKSIKRRSKKAKEVAEQSYGRSRRESKDDKTDLALEEVHKKVIACKNSKPNLSQIIRKVFKDKQNYPLEITEASLRKAYDRKYVKEIKERKRKLQSQSL